MHARRVIVLVDANPRSRAVYRAGFARTGWRVHSAIDGRAAVRLLDTDPIDAIVAVPDRHGVDDALDALETARRTVPGAVRVLVRPHGMRVETPVTDFILGFRAPAGSVLAAIERRLDRGGGMVPSAEAMAAPDTFVEDHTVFVRGIAQRIRVELDLSTDIEDLMADGFHGLVEARASFDDSRGAKFTTFAYYRVRGAILDGVRRMGFASRRAQERFRRLAAAEVTLETEGAVQAVEGGPGATLVDDTATVDDIVGKMIASVIATAAGDEERAPAESPEDAVISQFERAKVRRAVASLSDREQIVIRGLYFEERVLDDIGAQLNLTRSGASRLHTKALATLRAALG